MHNDALIRTDVVTGQKRTQIEWLDEIDTAMQQLRKMEVHRVAADADFELALAPANPDPLVGGSRIVRHCARNPVCAGFIRRGRSFSHLLSGNTRRSLAAGMERGDVCPRAVTVSRLVLLPASRYAVTTRGMGVRWNP